MFGTWNRRIVRIAIIIVLAPKYCDNIVSWSPLQFPAIKAILLCYWACLISCTCIDSTVGCTGRSCMAATWYQHKRGWLDMLPRTLWEYAFPTNISKCLQFIHLQLRLQTMAAAIEQQNRLETEQHLSSHRTISHVSLLFSGLHTPCSWTIMWLAHFSCCFFPSYLALSSGFFAADILMLFSGELGYLTPHTQPFSFPHVWSIGRAIASNESGTLKRWPANLLVALRQ